MKLQAIAVALLLLPVAAASLANPKGKAGRTVEMSVTDKGFEPALVEV